MQEEVEIRSGLPSNRHRDCLTCLVCRQQALRVTDGLSCHDIKIVYQENKPQSTAEVSYVHSIFLSLTQGKRVSWK